MADQAKHDPALLLGRGTVITHIGHEPPALFLAESITAHVRSIAVRRDAELRDGLRTPIECIPHPVQEEVLLAVAGDPHALKLAVELDINVNVASVLVEMKKRRGSPRKIAALSLTQLGEFAQFREQRLYPIKIFLRCVPHASSMAEAAAALQAAR